MTNERFFNELMMGVEFNGNEVAFTNVDTGMTNRCTMVVFDKMLDKTFNFTITLEEKERIAYLIEVVKCRREKNNATRC